MLLFFWRSLTHSSVSPKFDAFAPNMNSYPRTLKTVIRAKACMEGQATDSHNSRVYFEPLRWKFKGGFWSKRYRHCIILKLYDQQETLRNKFCSCILYKVEEWVPEWFSTETCGIGNFRVKIIYDLVALRINNRGRDENSTEKRFCIQNPYEETLQSNFKQHIGTCSK